MRRAFASNIGKPGSFKSLLLALENLDPAPELAALPIERWASTDWDQDATSDVLEAAWRNTARIGFLDAAAAWKNSEGPAGARMAQLKESGWAWPAWHTFQIKDGVRLDVRTVPPLKSLNGSMPSFPAALLSTPDNDRSHNCRAAAKADVSSIRVR